MSKIQQLWNNLGVFCLEDKVAETEVWVYLGQCQEEREHSDGPAGCCPYPFNVRGCMPEVVVVINCMSIAKMILKGFEVVTSCWSFLFRLLPKLSDLISTFQAKSSAGSHDIHDIVRLIHAPSIIFNVIEDATDSIIWANTHLIEVLKNMGSWDKHWSIAVHLDEHPSKTPLSSWLQGLQDAEPAIEDNIATRVENGLDHMQQ